MPLHKLIESIVYGPWARPCDHFVTVGILLCIVSKISYFSGWGPNYSIGHSLCIDICLDCCWLRRRRMSNKDRKPMHITMMRMANSLHFLSLSSGSDVPGSGGFWLRGKIPSRRFLLPSQIAPSLVLPLWKWEKSFRGLSLFYFPSCIISATVYFVDILYDDLYFSNNAVESLDLYFVAGGQRICRFVFCGVSNWWFRKLR